MQVRLRLRLRLQPARPASTGIPRAEWGDAHFDVCPSSAAQNPPALRGAMRILQRVRRHGTYKRAR